MQVHTNDIIVIFMVVLQESSRTVFSNQGGLHFQGMQNYNLSEVKKDLQKNQFQKEKVFFNFVLGKNGKTHTSKERFPWENSCVLCCLCSLCAEYNK